MQRTERSFEKNGCPTLFIAHMQILLVLIHNLAKEHALPDLYSYPPGNALSLIYYC